MSTKTLLHLCNELSLVTENIKEHYPELHQRLEINLSSPEDKTNHRDKDHESQVYLKKLKVMLQKQQDQHALTNANLPDAAGTLNYNPDKIQKKVINQRDGQKTILFAFAIGQELKTHTAPQDVVLVMLEGLCAFTLNTAEPEILHAGQVIIIPGKVKHSLRALSDFKMLLHL